MKTWELTEVIPEIISGAEEETNSGHVVDEAVGRPDETVCRGPETVLSCPDVHMNEPRPRRTIHRPLRYDD